MRILIISQLFQPEPHFKGLEFAKALRAFGHDVEVLTGFPNYPGGKVYEGYRVRLVQREHMDGIRVTRGYLYPSHDRSALRRIANYVSFAASTTLLAFARKRPDVVYVYTPPMTAALPAVALRLLRSVPFVCDIQDLWPDTLQATGMVNSRLILGLVGRWTKFALNRASRILVLSQGFATRLNERGLPASRIAVVPNWATPEIVQVAQALPCPKESGPRPFTILFAGNMGNAQALDVVLEAAESLQRRGSSVRFVMVGGGVDVDRLKTRARTFELSTVTFHPPRHPSDMGEMFASADALLVHLRDDPLFGITIPSKVQAYLAIGKPILIGVRGDAARMVAEAGAGIAFEPERADSLAAAADRLMKMSPEQRAQMGEAGRTYYRDRLSFEIGVAAIEKQLRAAARRA